MKKAFCFLICVSIIFLTMLGCQNLLNKTTKIPKEKEAETLAEDKAKNSIKLKIENSTKIEMTYGYNDYIVSITDLEMIKELEDLFNKSEFSKIDKIVEKQQLHITFYGEKGTTDFYINEEDYIKLEDNSYIKSDSIKFEKLISIYDDKLFSSKKKVENLLEKKIGNSLGMTIENPFYGTSAHIINQEEIKEIEDLFSKANLYKFDKPTQLPEMEISFYGKDDITRLYVDMQDYIMLQDGSYVKSKEIKFGKLSSLYTDKIIEARNTINVNTSMEETGDLVEERIKNSSVIVIGHDLRRSMKVLKDKESIREIEDLFNRAEFSKTNEPVKPPKIHITFYGEKGMTRFLMGGNDVIRLKDGRHVTSKDITYEKLLSILYKESIENSTKI